MVDTSAKSTLMMPWWLMRSDTPLHAWNSTWSAIWKASFMVVRSVAMLMRRWFGMVMRVSTT